MNKSISNIIKFVIFLALGILLIWLSLKDLTSQERTDIIASFKSVNYYWVLLSVLSGILSHLIRANRWRRLLAPMNYRPSLKNMFLATMVGYFANLAIPRLGEVSRCGILLKTDKIPISKSFGTIIAERVFDLIIFILIFIATVFIEHKRIGNYLNTNIYPKLSEKFAVFTEYNFIFILFGIIVIIVVLYLIFRKYLNENILFSKIKEIIKGFWHGLKSLFLIKNPLLFLLETIAIWVLYFFMIYLCFFAFADTSNLTLGAGLAALIIGAIGIMVTPGGIGLYPILIQETLKLYTIAKVTGLALGWVVWSAQTLMIVIVGSISLILISFSAKKNVTTQAEK